VGFIVLAITANLYDMQNMTHRLGFGPGGPFVNNVIVGIALLVAGLYFALRGRGWRLVVRVALQREQRRA
jgi:hypothetical protein